MVIFYICMNLYLSVKIKTYETNLFSIFVYVCSRTISQLKPTLDKRNYFYLKAIRPELCLTDR